MMNTRTIIYLVGALALGLLAGYFLFGGEVEVTDGHADHDHEAMEDGGAEAPVWTCSMHPQIRQDGPGDCPLCGMDLIPYTHLTLPTKRIVSRSGGACAIYIQ